MMNEENDEKNILLNVRALTQGISNAQLCIFRCKSTLKTMEDELINFNNKNNYNLSKCHNETSFLDKNTNNSRIRNHSSNNNRKKEHSNSIDDVDDDDDDDSINRLESKEQDNDNARVMDYDPVELDAEPIYVDNNDHITSYYKPAGDMESLHPYGGYNLRKKNKSKFKQDGYQYLSSSLGATTMATTEAVNVDRKKYNNNITTTVKDTNASNISCELTNLLRAQHRLICQIEKLKCEIGDKACLIDTCVKDGQFFNCKFKEVENDIQNIKLELERLKRQINVNIKSNNCRDNINIGPSRGFSPYSDTSCSPTYKKKTATFNDCQYHKLSDIGLNSNRLPPTSLGNHLGVHIKDPCGKTKTFEDALKKSRIDIDCNINNCRNNQNSNSATTNNNASAIGASNNNVSTNGVINNIATKTSNAQSLKTLQTPISNSSSSILHDFQGLAKQIKNLRRMAESIFKNNNPGGGGQSEMNNQTCSIDDSSQYVRKIPLAETTLSLLSNSKRLESAENITKSKLTTSKPNNSTSIKPPELLTSPSPTRSISPSSVSSCSTKPNDDDNDEYLSVSEYECKRNHGITNTNHINEDDYDDDNMDYRKLNSRTTARRSDIKPLSNCKLLKEREKKKNRNKRVEDNEMRSDTSCCVYTEEQLATTTYAITGQRSIQPQIYSKETINNSIKNNGNLSKHDRNINCTCVPCACNYHNCRKKENKIIDEYHNNSQNYEIIGNKQRNQHKQLNDTENDVSSMIKHHHNHHSKHRTTSQRIQTVQHNNNQTRNSKNRKSDH